MGCRAVEWLLGLWISEVESQRELDRDREEERSGDGRT